MWWPKLTWVGAVKRDVIDVNLAQDWSVIELNGRKTFM